MECKFILLQLYANACRNHNIQKRGTWTTVNLHDIHVAGDVENSYDCLCVEKAYSYYG